MSSTEANGEKEPDYSSYRGGDSQTTPEASQVQSLGAIGKSHNFATLAVVRHAVDRMAWKLVIIISSNLFVPLDT